MTVPRATVRLQFHEQFTLDDALPLVDYYARLGVSHLYASPLTQARSGSTHGYDTIDYDIVSPALGGEAALRRLVSALRAAGMGLILDIVPNHMATGPENPWWQDVLRWGRRSRYADFFDIDWDQADTELDQRLLAPFLGGHLHDELSAGHVRLAFDGDAGRFEVAYHAARFPVTPPSYAVLLQALPEASRGPLLPGLVEACGGGDAPQPERWELMDECLKQAWGTPAGRDEIGSVLAAFGPDEEGGGAGAHTRLSQLLEHQHYRLAWWRTAAEAINWRRFFEITDLAGLRVERPEVFEATHRLPFRLYAEGLVDGLRIDHIDGLADPAAYLHQLRTRLAQLQPQRPEALRGQPPLIWVEKILAADETLDPRWPVDGTTGYDFMDQVGALLHDPAGEQPLLQAWQHIGASPSRFANHVHEARGQLIDLHFAGEAEAIARGLQAILRDDARRSGGGDWALPAVRRVLRELLLHVAVYRTYVDAHGLSPTDQAVMAHAAGAAATRLQASDRQLLGAIRDALGRMPAGQHTGARCRDRLHVTRRFQQLTAPLAAKSVEDTAFFRYGRLLSRNEVGSEPDAFSLSPHAAQALWIERARTLPRSLLATGTHDHKRGEDARARIAALSELAPEWTAAAVSWLEAAAAGRDDAPRSEHAYVLLQTVVGHWPPTLAPDDREGLRDYGQRLKAWQLKSLREGKQASSWFEPDVDYEARCEAYLDRLLDPGAHGGLLGRIHAFVRERLEKPGLLNSLSQTALKLCVPGVPDLYQGNERWDFSLMDPDNRRAVDFASRLHDEVAAWTGDELRRRWREGQVKQRLIKDVLQLRKAHADLFAHGSYLPLQASGAQAAHVFAFARQHGDQALLVAVPLRASRLLAPGSADWPVLEWGGTQLVLPAGWSRQGWHRVTGSAEATLDLEPDFPVSIWFRQA